MIRNTYTDTHTLRQTTNDTHTTHNDTTLSIHKLLAYIHTYTQRHILTIYIERYINNLIYTDDTHNAYLNRLYLNLLYLNRFYTTTDIMAHIYDST